MIGVKIDEARSIAVSIDADGGVRARASADGPPPKAVPAAIAALGTDLDSPLAIASPFDHPSPVVADTMDAIGRQALETAIREARPSARESSGVGAASAGTFGSIVVISTGIAAAAAEAWIGAAKGVQDVAFFAVDDHATAGLVRSGMPVAGSRGRAASVAWLALNPVEREDYRRVGCLEAEVAAAGIVRRLVWRIKAGDRSQVQELVGDDLPAITLDHVLEAARHGDGVAISVIRDTAKYLAMAAANLVAVVDPEILVLGGIMATAGDLLLEPVRTEIARRLPRPMAESLTIAPAALGLDAAAIGAARLAVLAPAPR